MSKTIYDTGYFRIRFHSGPDGLPLATMGCSDRDVTMSRENLAQELHRMAGAVNCEIDREAVDGAPDGCGLTDRPYSSWLAGQIQVFLENQSHPTLVWLLKQRIEGLAQHILGNWLQRSLLEMETSGTGEEDASALTSSVFNGREAGRPAL